MTRTEAPEEKAFKASFLRGLRGQGLLTWAVETDASVGVSDSFFAGNLHFCALEFKVIARVNGPENRVYFRHPLSVAQKRFLYNAHTGSSPSYLCAWHPRGVMLWTGANLGSLLGDGPVKYLYPGFLFRGEEPDTADLWLLRVASGLTGGRWLPPT